MSNISICDRCGIAKGTQPIAIWRGWAVGLNRLMIGQKDFCDSCWKEFKKHLNKFDWKNAK